MRTYLILLILLSLIACGTAKYTSEVNNKYKPITKFKAGSLAPIGSDTADFLQYNFIDHKDKYIGKKFAAFMVDMKLNVHDVTCTPIYYDRQYCDKVHMYFYNTGYVRNGVEFYLVITFQEKFIYKELDDICIKNNRIWSKEQYEYLKDKVIKDIVLGDSRQW